MNALSWLISLHSVGFFQTKEGAKVGPASNSELRRWFKNGAIQVNGAKLSAEDELPEDVTSIGMFPSSAKHRCTLM